MSCERTTSMKKNDFVHCSSVQGTDSSWDFSGVSVSAATQALPAARVPRSIMRKELHYLKALLATLQLPLTLVSWHLEETNQRKVNVTEETNVEKWWRSYPRSTNVVNLKAVTWINSPYEQWKMFWLKLCRWLNSVVYGCITIRDTPFVSYQRETASKPVCWIRGDMSKNWEQIVPIYLGFSLHIFVKQRALLPYEK